MKFCAVLVSFLLSAILLPAQTPVPVPVPTASFSTTPEVQGLRFTPQPPPLLPPVAGAPKPFYTYYWEFGDGDFSFESNPVHQYPAKGSYQALLYATAHYDDDNDPSAYSRAVLADAGTNPAAPPADVFPDLRSAVALKAHRQPRAGEEIVLMISYRNTTALNTEGRLHLFYNEKKFKDLHFAFVEARPHAGETLEAIGAAELFPPAVDWAGLGLPHAAGGSAAPMAWPAPPADAAALLAEARKTYRDEQRWQFGWLKPGEKRNLFVTLRGTPEMLRDTSAFIHLQGIFEPLDPAVPAAEFTLEIEIVSSHDPNLIAVSDHRVDFRRLGNQQLDYKVRFQNNGEGPARRIQLSIKIPEGLNAARMRPLEWYPKCPICPDSLSPFSCLDTATTANGLVFTFRNIYLPGSRQKGVSDYDSTQGFVRYRIEPERSMPKLAFRSQAQIVFDKNPPIHTNFSKTRFKMGLSPGLKAGYAFAPDSLKDGYIFLGFSLSPYKSWKIYPQVEVISGIKGQQELASVTDTSAHIVPPAGVDFYTDSVVITTTSGNRGFFTLEVPVLLRKNFTRFLGAGIGASAQLIFENGNNTIVTQKITTDYEIIMGQFHPVGDPQFTQTDPVTTAYNLTRKRFTVFGDLTVGAVRAGLNLGIRGGVVLGKEMRPFMQLSLELKL